MDGQKSDEFKYALDHAWNWFTLHATQRLQAVHFFILTSTVLSTGYIAAFNYKHFAAALFISMFGMFVAFLFFRIEQRIRHLLKAAEAALEPLQRRLAADLGVPELELCARIESTHPAWPYSRVFRYLYFGAATVGAIGMYNAAAALWNSRSFDSPINKDLVLSALGAVLLAAGGELLLHLAHRSANASSVLRQFMRALGMACLAVGLAVIGYVVYVSVGNS